jgi:hypothetical protein
MSLSLSGNQRRRRRRRRRKQKERIKLITKEHTELLNNHGQGVARK